MSALLDFYAKHSRLFDQIGLNAILALSLSVSLQAGQLALAQAAFMGIAAYVSAVLAMNAHWPLLATIAAAMLASTIVAVLPLGTDAVSDAPVDAVPPLIDTEHQLR